MKQNRMKATRIAIATLFGAVGALTALPACAETEVEALKRELAEQRALIEKLLAAQASQQEAIKKIEARPEQAPAQASNNAVELPKGLTLYGTMDVNIASNNSGYGRKTTIGSGGMNSSSLGVKGQKELMDGVRLVGQLEMGIDFSTGIAGNGNKPDGANKTKSSSGGLDGTGAQLFSRQAYAGIATDKFGQITLGRQYSGSYIATAVLGTAFGSGFYGSSATFLPIIGGEPTRLNNAAVYRSPTFSGFSAQATYTTGNENNVNSTIVSGCNTASCVTDSSGKGWDAALTYQDKKLTGIVTSWHIKQATFDRLHGETGLATKTGWQAVASYDFGFAKLYGNYISGKISGGNYQNVTKTLSKANGWTVSASVPFGKHTILVGYTKLDDKSQLNRDGKQIGIAYTYRIQDTTWLYINYGKQINDRNSDYSLMNGGDLVGLIAKPGYDASGVMMGVNTKF